ncbi:MAG TPA: carboxypeptidase regulatory-like domain-containing protein [Granulicella sp.]
MLNLWRACCVLFLSCIGMMGATICRAQGPAPTASKDGVLTGLVLDPSGAKVSHAAVHVEGPGLQRDTTTDDTGRFTLPLPAGAYEVIIVSAGFDPYVSTVKVAGQSAPTDIQASLVIATETEQVDVAADTGISTANADNRSALVFKASQLAELADDNATLQQQVLAIAGGDGQHPPQVFVDGFSSGSFPPKSAIREIRINQNPYSAQYDSPGFGRVEIFTKPGSNTLHGSFGVIGNDSSFNSLNPYATNEPPYHRLELRGDINGPIGKKTSFFFNGDYNDQQNNAVINAITLDPTFQFQVPLSQTLQDPQTINDYSARLDRQLTTNNTFTARYEYNRIDLTNGGIGPVNSGNGSSTVNPYTLPSQAYNSSVSMQTLQFGNTQVIGPHIVSESRFQYIRTRTTQDPTSTAPAITVQGAFNGGGNPAQILHDNQDSLEFQQYVSIAHGTHFIRTGARARLFREANLATANYNGQFIFPNITSYQITQQGLQAGDTDAQIRATCEQAGSELACGGATQFSITAGLQNASVYTTDLEVYAEDEWKARKDLTLSYGFRFEAQSAVPSHADPAPRAGFAWAIHQTDKKPARVVLRGGGGLFFDRFAVGDLLTAVRQGSAANQQTYYITNPGFESCASPSTQNSQQLCNIPDAALLGASTPPTTYNINPHLHSEYSITAGLSAEISLGKYGSFTSNYLIDRGVHQWQSLNINAPLPGTYDPSNPLSGVRPFGSAVGNEYQFNSTGESLGRFFFNNLQLKVNKHLSAWSFFNIPRANADVSGSTAFPSNQYDPHQDYGRTSWIRHANFFGGLDSDMPWGLSAGAFLVARAGKAFNITTGQDNNGDTQFNDRPAFATDLTRPSVVRTAYGNFDTSPMPGQTIIPINYGHGPAFVSLQLQVRETFKFGPRPPAPPPEPGAPHPTGPVTPPSPRYSLTFSAEAQNVTNTVSAGTPVGVLNSPLFGKSISTANSFISTSAANRTILLRTQFEF